MHFLLDVQNIDASTGDTELKIDSADPASRKIVNNIYPLRKDINLGSLAVFQSTTQLTGSSFIPAMVTGSMTQAVVVNANSTLKMTASLAASVPGPPSNVGEANPGTYKWGVLMVANSGFEG